MRSIRSLVLALAALWAVATGLAAAAPPAAAQTLTVFGDSYSDVDRRSFPNWAEQLLASRRVDRLVSYANSGATAARVGGNTLARQVSAWRARDGRFGSGEVVVVYLGYNDIAQFSSQSASRAGYEAGLGALVDGGAGRGGAARLVLIAPHDVGATPRFNATGGRDTLRRRTLAWNSFVASAARAVGATVVNLLPTFDRVAASPSSFGLTNVRTADPSRSRTTALYDDDFHFGQRGQGIIAQTVGPRVGG